MGWWNAALASSGLTPRCAATDLIGLTMDIGLAPGIGFRKGPDFAAAFGLAETGWRAKPLHDTETFGLSDCPG